MKTIPIFICVFFFFIDFIASSQTAKIAFSYDAAGNQFQRSLCINCTLKSVKPNLKEIVAVKEEDFENFFPDDAISYYPNPVQEELILKWELKYNNSVNSIQVFSLNGQLLESYRVLENLNTQSIQFQKYPSGVYAVLLNYSNGEQKSIKIIKE